MDLTWRSFELRPKGAPPISPEYKAQIETNRPRLFAIAREQYGLELNQGPFGIDSRPALVGAKYAEAQGVGRAYHKAVMDAYWRQAKDISDLSVLKEIAASVGLDAAEFAAALEDADYDQEVSQDIHWAQQYGLNSVPSIVLAGKYLIPGAQPYATLAQAADQVLAEAQAESDGADGDA